MQQDNSIPAGSDLNTGHGATASARTKELRARLEQQRAARYDQQPSNPNHTPIRKLKPGAYDKYTQPTNYQCAVRVHELANGRLVERGPKLFVKGQAKRRKLVRAGVLRGTASRGRKLRR